MTTLTFTANQPGEQCGRVREMDGDRADRGERRDPQ